MHNAHCTKTDHKKSSLSILCSGEFFFLLFNHKSYNLCKAATLSKRPKIGFQDQLSLNVGQKYCRMLQREHSAILSTFIKLPFVIKIFVLSIFEWPFHTGFTVLYQVLNQTLLAIFMHYTLPLFSFKLFSCST